MNWIRLRKEILTFYFKNDLLTHLLSYVLYVLKPLCGILFCYVKLELKT